MSNGFHSLVNYLFFFALEACSVLFMMNEKVADWVYNKKFCNDLFAAITYCKNYSSLKDDYEKILEENCKLREFINDNGIVQKSKKKRIFEILSATVINNLTSLNRNYFTIDKGSKCGIKEGMSVVSDEGFVGVIANVGDYYSTIIPLLHDNFYVSAQLKNSNATGTVKWDGESLKQTRMLYVPRYIEVQVGEEIFTSGFNSSICSNILIGTVDHVENTDDASFHSIVVNLKTDFNTLHNVYVMSNELLKKKIELEKKTIEQYG